ncbi:hypothetical protein [Sphingomonas mesophila]|uniref:hypothetical protein n=1 Tax=Sphingomonas mesophila TaxID=2303576 RepID=UPI000E57B7E4|nr:hypothetical protein [Sphingomonas mesophila]
MPALSGHWLTGFKILFFALLAMALIGVTVGSWKEQQRSNQTNLAYYGAGLRADSELRVSPMGNPASTIVPRSRLLAIDGQPQSPEKTAANRRKIAEALDGPIGRRLEVTMRAPDGAVTTHQIVRGPQYLAASDAAMPLTYRTRAAFYVAVDIILSTLAIVAAILLFRGRPRDPVVALLSTAFLAIPAMSTLLLLGDTALAEAIGTVGGKVASACILLGLLVFPSGRFEPRWSLIGIPLIAAVVLRDQLFAQAPVFDVVPGMLALLTIIAAVLVRYRRLAPGIEGQQVKWAVLGLTILVATQLVSLPLDLLQQRNDDEWFYFVLAVADSVATLLGFVALFGGLIVSLLRFRLYDAEAAISKSAVYAAMTVALIGTFAATEKLIEILSERYLAGDAGAYAGAAGAGLAAVMIAPLHKRMSGWAERRFQKGLLRLRRDLPLLVGDLRETSSTRTLAETALARIIEPVRACRGAILVATAKGEALVASRDVEPAAVSAWLAANRPEEAQRIERDDSLFPYRAPLAADGVGTVGWLLLGPRPDGTMIGKDEREALEGIDEALARALAITRARERQQSNRDRERRGMARRLKELERMVMGLVGQSPKPA